MRFSIISVLLLCAMAMQAQAAIITVINTNDSGPGSLRQALVDANDGDTIDFAVTGTIGLTSGELLVNKVLTISGPGAENLAVNGNAKSTVFHVAPGETVTISGLTIELVDPVKSETLYFRPYDTFSSKQRKVPLGML